MREPVFRAVSYTHLKKTIQFLTLIVNAYTPLSLSQITFLMGYREMPMEMLTIMYELGCLLDLKRTETGTKIRLANETFRQHLRENYADVMQAQLSDWIQMILVQGSKELDNGASADLYKNEGAIYLYEMCIRDSKYAPTILFIDEIDAIGKNRQSAGDSNSRADILNALLTEMSGFKTTGESQV